MSTYYCASCLTTFGENGERCTNLGCGSRRPDTGWGVLLGSGDLLDRHYRIDRPLAVGGAGLTYLAREVDTAGVAQPPDLAIKVLYAARAAGAFLHRLSTEAQILQELNHENIVQLRGFVHRAGQEPYLVTLFEHGGNLTELVDSQGALPVKVAAGIVVQILAALDVAHQRGVVHRDLKPDNVLLRERVDPGELPHVRVADFGIAKVAGAMGNVTKHGTFVGTPEYAAPEQFEGMDPTPATDVFAAGALFVHLLTGRNPITFSVRTDIQTCRSEWLAALPPRLDPTQLHGADAVELVVLQEVLDHMMDVRPERRWTVQQVLARLDGLAHGNAELRRRETLELTGKPAPSRHTEPGLAAPTAAAYLDDDGFPVPDDGYPVPEDDVPTAPATEPPDPDEPDALRTQRFVTPMEPDDTSTGFVLTPRARLEEESSREEDTDGPDANADAGEAPSDAERSEPEMPEPPPEPEELKAPPLPGRPPDPARQEARMESSEPVEGAGLGGCFAALAGLGVAGVGVLVVVGLLVVALLGGAAWQLGYFDGPRTVVLTGPKPTGPKSTGPKPTAPEPPGPKPVGPEPTGPEPTGPEPTGPEPTGPEPTGPEPTGPEPTGPGPVPVPPQPLGDPNARLAPGSDGWRAIRDALDPRREAVSTCGLTGVVVGTAWVKGGRVTEVQIDRGYGAADPTGCAESALIGAEVAGVEGWARFGL
ncbi:MAG: protein kinase [Myxococcota bacterium]